jgi:hypothetical protein
MTEASARGVSEHTLGTIQQREVLFRGDWRRRVSGGVMSLGSNSQVGLKTEVL